MKIRVDNGQFFADGFAVRHAFTLEEGESRYVSYLSNVGCGTAMLTLREGTLSAEGRIGVIRYAWGAELYPLPLLPLGENAAEREVTLGTGTALISVRGGDPAMIRVTGAARYEHTPARALWTPRLSVIEGQRSPILRVDAKCDVGEYLLLLALREGDCALLLEEVGERIRSEGNEVRVERTYADKQARHCVTRCLWRGDRFECSREIVCANEHICMREEKGLALLEAVAAKDEKAIAALLSPEIADVGTILDYFGEILSVRPAEGVGSPTAATAITRDAKGLRGTTYDFEFDEEGRISNVALRESGE